MTTTTYHVGTGQTYATLNAWQAAGGMVRNLVTADECIVIIVHGGANCLSASLTIDAGWTTDATHTITIQANTGEHWTNLYSDLTEATMNALGVAYGSVSGSAINNNGKNVTIKGLYLAIIGDDATNALSGPVYLRDCCMHFKGAAGQICTGLVLTSWSGQAVNTMVAVNGSWGSSTAVTVVSVTQTAVPHFVGCTLVSDAPLANSVTDIQENCAGLWLLNTLLVRTSPPTGGVCAVGTGKDVIWDHCAATDATLSGTGTVINCLESVAVADLMSTVGAVISDLSKARKVARPHAYGNDSSGKAVDAFGNQRLSWDIGCYQTLPLTATEIQTIFKDIGLFVRTSNLYANTVEALVEAETGKRIAQITSGLDRLTLLGTAMANDASKIQTLSGWSDNEARSIDTYIRGYVRDMTGSTGQQSADVLADLDYCMKLASQKLAGLAVSAQVTLDATGNGTVSGLTLGQMLNEQTIVLTCSSAQTAGAEQWTLTGQVDRLSGVATTGQAYTDATTGLGFTINSGSTPWAEGDRILLHVTNDGDAVFQRFFRKQFSYVFEQSAVDGTETILDSWAE